MKMTLLIDLGCRRAVAHKKHFLLFEEEVLVSKVVQGRAGDYQGKEAYY